MLTVREPAELNSLHSLQGLVRDYLAERGVKGPDIFSAELVCEELLVNSATHGQASEVEVKVELVDGKVRMEWRDDGVEFDPTKPLTESPEIGGKGLILVREFFPALQYRRESNGNVLLLQ